jgi:hypothetical protein
MTKVPPSIQIGSRALIAAGVSLRSSIFCDTGMRFHIPGAAVSITKSLQANAISLRPKVRNRYDGKQNLARHGRNRANALPA